MLCNFKIILFILNSDGLKNHRCQFFN